MLGQAREDVARVLPDRLGDDEGRIGIDLAEDLDPARLAVDEAVLLLGIVGVAPHDPRAELAERLLDGLLEVLLRGPAALVRGEARVAARDEDDFLRPGLD